MKLGRLSAQSHSVPPCPDRRLSNLSRRGPSSAPLTGSFRVKKMSDGGGRHSALLTHLGNHPPPTKFHSNDLADEVIE